LYKALSEMHSRDLIDKQLLEWAQDLADSFPLPRPGWPSVPRPDSGDAPPRWNPPANSALLARRASEASYQIHLSELEPVTRHSLQFSLQFANDW